MSTQRAVRYTPPLLTERLSVTCSSIQAEATKALWR